MGLLASTPAPSSPPSLSQLQHNLLAKDPDLLRLTSLLHTRLLKSIGLGVCIGAFVYFLLFLSTDQSQQMKQFSKTQCIVCQSHHCEVIILPCLHFNMCKACSKRITDECPVCRIQIERTMDILDFLEDANGMFNE